MMLPVPAHGSIQRPPGSFSRSLRMIVSTHHSGVGKNSSLFFGCFFRPLALIVALKTRRPLLRAEEPPSHTEEGLLKDLTLREKRTVTGSVFAARGRAAARLSFASPRGGA